MPVLDFGFGTAHVRAAETSSSIELEEGANSGLVIPTVVRGEVVLDGGGFEMKHSDYEDGHWCFVVVSYRIVGSQGEHGLAWCGIGAASEGCGFGLIGIELQLGN
ncbi:hypothetical protein M0R45_035508 [Rubus argutus]|uniref:Uncharacterized protein n=1 Tax=Rubus argutus TaxID=59490 RepID=A0AAW1VU86_RUBAR